MPLLAPEHYSQHRKKIIKEKTYIMDQLIRITKNITFADLKSGKKTPLDVYSEQMESWIFRPLVQLASDKKVTFENGYAMFALELLFFEPHGKYLSGNSISGSNKTFSHGFQSFLNYLQQNNLVDSNTLNKIQTSQFYKISRCGIFHDMTIKSGLLIDSIHCGKTQVFYYNASVNKILVSPWNFLDAQKKYFSDYIQTLVSNNQSTDYKNFEKTFKTLFKY